MNQRTGSIALVVILIACTLAIIAFVMSNGSSPIGPSITPGIIVNDIDVSESGIVAATNVDNINLADGNFVVTESPDAQANVSLANDIVVMDTVTGDQWIFGNTFNNCNSTIDHFTQTGAGEIAFCARGNISQFVDTNNNGATNCVRYVGTSSNLLAEICEGNFISNNGIIRNMPQSVSCVDSGGVGPGSLTIVPTHSTVLVTVMDVDGCNITMSEVGMSAGNIAYVVNISANDMIFQDIPGQQEIPGGVTLTFMQWESLYWNYVGDRWVTPGF